MACNGLGQGIGRGPGIGTGKGPIRDQHRFIRAAGYGLAQDLSAWGGPMLKSRDLTARNSFNRTASSSAC